MSNDDYHVGYGKPPVKNRFQKGQSGNPSGRPKKSNNVNTLLMEAFGRKILLKTKDGAERYVTQLEGVILSILNGAMKGNVRQQEMILKYAFALGHSDPFHASAADKAILAKAIAEMAAKQQSADIKNSRDE